MPSKTAIHIGKAIASRRFLANLSVAELAERVGVTRQAIDYLERGINTPRMQTLEAIAKALECDTKDLMP